MVMILPLPLASLFIPDLEYMEKQICLRDNIAVLHIAWHWRRFSDLQLMLMSIFLLMFTTQNPFPIHIREKESSSK